MRDTKKKCLACGSPELMAVVTLVRAVALADRNGTLKIAGVKVGQSDLKDAWDKDGSGERKIRGPIRCAECDTEHFYVLGDKNPLRMGSYDEALEKGYDELRS